MIFSYCFFASSGFFHCFVDVCPSVPMRPKRVVKLVPSSLISQNLDEVPSTSSYLGMGIASAGQATFAAAGTRRSEEARDEIACGAREIGQRRGADGKIQVHDRRMKRARGYDGRTEVHDLDERTPRLLRRGLDDARPRRLGHGREPAVDPL